jgi:tetratricopeptide (TPR) repeat protein
MIRYFKRALDIFREINDNIGQRFPLGNLGIVYFERGEYERAFECFVALKGSLGGKADLMMEAKVDFSMGEIYLEVGLLDKARESCENALQIFMTIGNRQGESEVLGTLGGIHLSKGDVQIARGYFERSIEVKQAIGNMVGMLHSKITLARIANMEGRHDEAQKIAAEVHESAKKRGLRSIELECLTEIMVARAQLKNPGAALEILSPNEDPKLLSDSISSALITFAYKAGELAFQAGDEEKALSYIGLSGKIVEDILGRISEPEWREAYEKKRERILETYRRLKPAISKS